MTSPRSSTVSADRIADSLRRTRPAGQVHTEGPGYEAGSAVWNGAVTRRPAVVVRCSGAADVVAGLRAAREFDVPLAVRGGGHGWTGASLADGGVTLDLSGMRDVRVDATTATAAVMGGATSGDVAAAADAAGLVAATGTVDAVGMAGLALGGGYGPLSGRLGMAVDNVLSVDMVLADGAVVTADAEQHPDLFWAVRGGGGNFGVVTAMRLRLHRIPSLLTGILMWSLEEAPAVLAALGDPMLHGPDELTVQTGVVTAPTGAPVLFAAPTWCGEPADADAALAALNRLGTPVLAGIGPATLPEMLARTGAMFPFGRHVELRSRILPRLADEVIATLVEHAGSMTSPLSAISVHSCHGAAVRSEPAATAFGLREPHLMVENIAVWEGDDPVAADHRAWARDLSAALAPHASPGGYANLLGPDEHEQIDAAYGPNAGRLRRIKDAYDPGGVFAAIPLPGTGQ